MTVVFALVATMGTVVLGSASLAAPGNPGVPQPGTLLYSEDFSNVDASAAPVRIGDYVGGAAADGETYTADAAWSPGVSACNGWVMRLGTPLPPNGGAPAVTNNDECDRNQAFAHLGDMAEAMGLYQGMSAAAAAQNQILSEYTNTVSGAQAAGIQLQTTNNSIPTIAGHFYAVSAIFAETNCFSNHARQELSLLVNGVPTVLGSNLDPCTDPSARAYDGGNISVAKLQSGAIQVPLTGATPTLGLRVRNMQATGTGNDVGFDLPQIVDVTPQLDKEFSPAVITQGDSSTLTFTVTNTTDLMAKNGWSFTDNLPAGLVASGPVGGTCDLTASTVTSGSISATGNLAQGQASCTITVQVTSNTPGVYSNSGCTDTTGAAIPNCTNNVPTIVGLYPPGSTPLTVLPKVDLSITKSADLDSYTPGQPITYTVTVHNDGPSDAIDATFTDPIPAAVTGATWTCAVTAAGTANLPPAGPTTCGASGSGDITDTVRINVGGTITYTVTGTVAAGTTGNIVNTATVVPAEETTIPVMPGGGPNQPPGSTTTVPTVDDDCPPAPGEGCSATVTTPGSAIGIVKTISSVTDTNNNGLDDAGDVIHYTIVTTNTGQSTLTDVTVTDVLAAPAGPALSLSCTPTTPATLAPGATISCTADYVITAADAQKGTVDNTATATGTPPDGPNVTANDTATQPVQTQATGLTLVKSAAITKDANNDNLAGVGDEITFTFHVKNTGNVTLTSVGVTDVLVPPAGPEVTVTCPSTTLAPGAEMDCTSSVYVVTQADVDTGSVANDATAHGTPPGTTTPVVTPPSSTTTPTPVPTPGLTLLKTASITKDANNDNLAGVGDEITFTFHVKNTGNVTLTNVGVTDVLVAPAGPEVSVTCPSTTLLPGAEMDCTSSVYVVTQADVDTGSVANDATAHGTPPKTTTPVVTPPSSTTTPTPVAAPGLSILKSAVITKDANNDDLAGVGDEITFTFHVKNTGNVTLTNVGVTDVLTPPAAPEVSVSCPATTLVPGAEMDCTSSVYVVTQADVDTGSIKNAATAHGTPPGTTTPVVTPPSTTTTPTPVTPGLSLVKSASITKDANNDGKAGVGDEITFSFVVKNTGAVTLTDVSVTDVLVAPAGPEVSVTCPATTLAPGAQMTCTSSVYVVTQADVDAGSVANEATAKGTPPGTTTPVVTPPSTTTTPTPVTPALSLVKSASITKDANNDGKAGVGDEITFSFVVKNTGTVTMNNITVDDVLVAPAGPEVSITCPATTLAPGAQMTCTSSVYVVTQADVDAGSVANEATAKGTPPGTTTPVVTPPSKTTTPTPTTAQLALVKSAAITKDANEDGKAGVGDEITFSFSVTNTGAVTMKDISVTDVLVAPAGPEVSVTCPATTLAPGAQMVCTSTPYVVTQADVDAGSVKNAATAKGTPPTGPPVVTPPSKTTTPTPDPAPGLSLVKSAAITKDANGDELAGVGDEITYYFDLANTGNVTLTDVRVDDELLAEVDVTVTCPSTTLAPGQEMECVSGVYVTTQADIDAGYVRNIATATGKTPPPPGSDKPRTVDTPPSVVDVPTAEPVDPPGSLPFTGSNTVPYVATGLLLLMVGIALVLVARRRREPQAA